MIRVEDDNVAKYTLAVEEAIAEFSPDAEEGWENIGLLTCGASQVVSAMNVKSLHRNAVVGSFDLADVMFEHFADGSLLFGIDQQPFIQGGLPVYLLTYGMSLCVFPIVPFLVSDIAYPLVALYF